MHHKLIKFSSKVVIYALNLRITKELRKARDRLKWLHDFYWFHDVHQISSKFIPNSSQIHPIHQKSILNDIRWFVGDIWWLFDEFIMLFRCLRHLLSQEIVRPSGSGWHFQKLHQNTKRQKMILKL